MKKSLIIGCIISLCFIVSCISKDDYNTGFDVSDNLYDIYPATAQNSVDTTSYSLSNDHPAIISMRVRAKRLSKISWFSKGSIPKVDGSYYTTQEYIGIPYSSVKELNKFVGQEVSFHTFLAAVNNPRSVLYTEEVDKFPYKGTNCASYYGTVCSMSVNYALGLERPYGSSMYETLPFMQKLAHQDFRYVAPGDIVWRKGHVVLITDVWSGDNGLVTKVEVLESGGAGTSVMKFSIEDFKKRWDSFDWVLYRYQNLADLDDSHDSFLWNEELNNDKNDDISLDRGNWVTYREGEDVVVNVLSNKYETIDLIKDERIVETRPYRGLSDCVFSGLTAGDYKIRLSSEEGYSKCVFFEVINNTVSVEKNKKWVKIHFDSTNAYPEYLVFCDEKGGNYFISDIIDTERSRCYKIVRCDKSIKGLYVKVFFKGSYGRVSNSIIPISD